jgi:ABC-2 type transport system permease protein
MTTAMPNPARPASSPFSSLLAQTRAEVLALVRYPALMIPTLLFPVIFWVFFGLPNAQKMTADGHSVGAYMLASFAMISVIQTMLYTLGFNIAIERSTGWYRYQRTTPLRLWPMFGAKLLADLLLALLALGLLLVIGAWTGDVHLPLAAWASLVVGVLFGGLPFAALGVFIGYVATGSGSASSLINLIFLPMSIASGLFIPLDSMPSIVQQIAPFLPAYHGGMLARVAVGVPSASPQWVHVVWLLGFTVVFLALAVWAYQRDEGANYR